MPSFRPSSLISILPLSVLAAQGNDQAQLVADVYDYVVVGAGSGGCPLASKLAQAGHKVLLMEAGPDSDHKGTDTDGNEVDPLRTGTEFGFQFSPDIDDAVISEPTWEIARNTKNRDARFCAQPGVDCSDTKMPYKEFMPRARIVGGCSMHNYLTYIRPSPDFMEKWGPGWEWNTVLPKLIDMEHSLEVGPVDPKFHGKTGPAYVANSPLQETDKIMIDLMTNPALGVMPKNTDINGETRHGFGPLPKLTKDGKRWSAAQAWLTPEVRALPNFHLKTMSFATRIEFEGTRATGVKYTQDGVDKLANATKEVILSGGAFRSPQLLMLSGIGPKNLYNDVDPLTGLPFEGTFPSLKKLISNRTFEGVGRNLQDHLQAVVRSVIPNASLGLGGGGDYGTNPNFKNEYSASKGGLVWPNISGIANALPEGYDGMAIGGFYYSKWCTENAECNSPDMEFMCGSYPNFTPLPDNGLFVCTVIINGDIQSHPGFLTLKSTNPLEYPSIFPNYLGSEIDIQRMAEGAKMFAEEVAAQRPDVFNTFAFPKEQHPIPIERYREYVMESATTIYHPVGTCKMGPASDPLAVTDQQGRVHGVEALRVADASIMPVIANVNTDVPVRLIGYHIADMILGETQLVQ